ncbi:MAG TPA: 2-aminoethylphosphonate aminotransferase [Xanthomonadales bacterium]|nr:2-aminoethylphosphonate aminotransferase [Xanthomonadales bacterium]
MRSILLNPGPVSISEGVRHAMAAEDLCHREPEFFELQQQVRSKLARVYSLDPAQWVPVLLGGSGTTALESMVSSLLPADAQVLVLENGVYGERLSRLAAIHGIPRQAITTGWKDAWKLDQVQKELASGNYTHILAVQHETTTGRLNPVQALARLCEQAGVGLLLDTVSSFGAEEIPFASPALMACAATANKCLHGIPGSCMVLVRREALDSAVKPARTMTLDLALWADHQQRQSTPFTPPVTSLLALNRALDEFFQSGGQAGRHARYLRLANRVAQCLDKLGVKPMLEEGASSCVLRAYALPGGLDYEQLHDGLKLRGFVIYAGQGALAGEMFRISTMGDITDYDLGRLLAALEDVFA